jgi:cytidylate kinase
MPAPITIAIDGFSSTGKSTLAKQLAAKLGYVYIDSGAMYRAIAYYVMSQGFSVINISRSTLKEFLVMAHLEFRHVNGEQHIFLNGKDVEKEIRSMKVSDRVSALSARPEVRERMVALQQKWGKDKGVVMDGRDIGTVVFPNAELKIFMTASHEIRTQRRLQELRKRGIEVSEEEVSTNLKSRDEMDTTRATSPLLQAPDAVVLDNSHIGPEEQLEMALAWANERINQSNKS